MPYAVAMDFAAMAPKLAVSLPPFDVTGFDLKLHWHRRFDNEPRSQWLRDQLVSIFRDGPSVTLPPATSTSAIAIR
jgi:DNA-binding transcriptional LysR family regulator